MLKPFPATYVAFQLVLYAYAGIGNKKKTWSLTFGVVGADEAARLAKIQTIAEYITENLSKCEILSLKEFKGRHIEDVNTTPDNMGVNERYSLVKYYDKNAKIGGRVFVPVMQDGVDLTDETVLDNFMNVIKANSARLINMPGATPDVIYDLNDSVNFKASASEIAANQDSASGNITGSVDGTLFL